MLVASVYCLLFPMVTPSSKIPASTGPTRYIACLTHFVLLAIGMLFIPEAFAEIHLACIVLFFFWKLTKRNEWVSDPIVQQKVIKLRNWNRILKKYVVWPGVKTAKHSLVVETTTFFAFGMLPLRDARVLASSSRNTRRLSKPWLGRRMNATFLHPGEVRLIVPSNSGTRKQEHY